MNLVCMLVLTLMKLHQSPVVASPLRIQPSQLPIGLSEADQKFAEEYLQHFYGYQPKSDRQKRAADYNEDSDWTTGLCDKVKEMQRFFGLPPDGELNKETLAVMKKPRCGLSDVESYGSTFRWTKRTVSYRIARINLPFPATRIHKVIKGALNLWSSVSLIKFHKRKRREADIVIAFVSSEHGDRAPFDGKGGILAHAYLPGSGIGGDVHFDTAEEWNLNFTGISLLVVAAHEFGHALGLSHSSDPGSIMFPAYNFAPNFELQLSFDDVKNIQRLYGDQYWKLQQLILQEGFPRKISDLGFPNRIKSVDAALHFRNNRYTVFFTGHECWRYNEQQGVMEGSSMLIEQQWPGIPFPVDAAIFYEGFVNFFQGNKQYKYDFVQNRVVSVGSANDLLDCKMEKSNDDKL
ncbi:hypothetical protein AMECASPLE_007865 [Ameca splendens]|uniref:Peptidase metallopeptidase domain-containing protein n=1 Tax=Ameca splendens TaxID=208324 RepID=A0ABV0XZQ8_9TELE